MHIKYENHEIFIQIGGRWKSVGKVDEVERTLSVFRDRGKHLMRVWDAYGFSEAAMQSDEWFDYVLIKEEISDGTHVETNTYFVPRMDILVHGWTHQAEGFERQIFVKLEKLQEYKQ